MHENPYKNINGVNLPNNGERASGISPQSLFILNLINLMLFFEL